MIFKSLHEGDFRFNTCCASGTEINKNKYTLSVLKYNDIV